MGLNDSANQKIRGSGEFPDAIELLYGSQQLFTDAVSAYQEYADHKLSFTDAMTVAMVAQHNIDAVLSFDDDFDGIVDRLVPSVVADS